MTKASCLLALSAVLMLPMAQAAAKSVLVDQNDVTDSYDCEGGSASINGNHNTVTLSRCSEVTVAGNHNNVALTDGSALSVLGNHNNVSTGYVKKISTMGNHNNVTWTSHNDDEKPSVSNLGNHNLIARAKE